MKKLFLLLLSAVTGLVYGQDYIDINSKMPIDKNVTIGQLENGLTYYIRPNTMPENKIELRLVVNAGSILENDKQRGLAHFMEHMNFNGTKNFAHNELVDYLQTIGVKFGQHLNAYTSFDETVYILPIPSEDPEIVEKGFSIIEDWAFNCLLTPEEIDKERGVVLEELRLGLGADKRMMDRYLPKLMNESRYAERLPIGQKEVLKTFEYAELESFYRTWYRPNLMAVVVVGDISVEDAKKKIEYHFGGYPNPDEVEPRKNYFVPDHEETFVAIEQDEEASFARVQLYYKDQGNYKPDVLIADYRNSIVQELFNVMLSNRLEELTNSATPPFTFGYAGHGGTWARTKQAFQATAVTNPENMLSAFEALVIENKRVERHGFTSGELERAKKQMMARFERLVANKNKSESRDFAREYVGHFLEGEVIPGIDSEMRAREVFYPTIHLVEVNALIKTFIHNDNRVVVFTGPKGDDIPLFTENQVMAVFDDVDKMDIEPYVDEMVATSLIETMPEPGTITDRSEMASMGVKKIVLSNGATVYYKKTDFKDNEILMRGYSPGGTSLIPTDDYLKTAIAMGGIGEAGIGGFTQNDMMKMMAGKEVSVNPYVSSMSEGLRGRSTIEDVETMFQLVYLNMTNVNKDEAAYQAYVQKQTAMMGNILNMPQYWYMVERYKVTQKNNPRFMAPIPSAEDFENQDYDLAHKLFSERFANAGDFTFTIVGSIDEAQIEELCKKYIASLPSTDEREQFEDHPFEELKGEHTFVFNKGTDPKSKVDIGFSTKAAYDQTSSYHLRSAGELLTIKLVENLREGQSGVYGVGARGSASKKPVGKYSLSISFPCGPENAEKLRGAAIAELQKIKVKGPEQKDVDKIKEAQRLELKENMRKNNFWIGNMDYMISNDMPLETMLTFEERIEKLTGDDIQKALQDYVNEDVITTMLMPEE